jgi:nicotinate-nucleotide--dimethylbenzimidazole phosphoribosyltransferase
LLKTKKYGKCFYCIFATMTIQLPLFPIAAVPNELKAGFVQHVDNKTKPIGSLGALEKLAVQIANIQQSMQPAIVAPHVVVFAGDHGIASTGLVNPYPQAVTAQMVLNYVAGGAAVNVFARQNAVELVVVDAGVNHDFAKDLPIEHLKIAPGTNNYLQTAAMDEVQLMAAIGEGAAVVNRLHQKNCNCIGFGEMGIGNSSSASLLMSHILQLPIADCVGRGTGANDEQLRTKQATLEQVQQLHQGKIDSALSALQHYGGFEIAMMTGAYLQGAANKMVIVVDGFIATSALLVAAAINKAVLDYCVFAHTSGEQGHEKMLAYLKATPLLNLQMRLGEGSAAVLAMPLLRNAVAMFNEMASFQQANVSTATNA